MEKLRVLANDEFAFLNATSDSIELVPSCRNLVYGPETITETTLDLFLKLVPYCGQLFQLPHLGPLRAPRPLCLHVHDAHFYLALRHGSNKAPSSLPFTGRAICVMSPATIALLRFRDNFKSYYDRGVFVIVGAALFTSSP